jgi:Uncharacterized protein conserved in bacteria (DUF2272)
MSELTPEIITERIPKENSQSIEDIQDYLRRLETARDEIVSVGLYDPNGEDVNIVDYIERDNKIDKSQLEALIVAGDDELRQQLLTRTPVQYAVMNVRGIQKNILVARPGRQSVLRGKIATFGGPKDTGMQPNEGLAIIRDADIANVPGVEALFIDPGRGARGSNLANNQARYVACRWDYNVTPRQYLVATDVTVRNPLTGKSFAARPADWGPADWTGRVADLSDRLAIDLGLSTDDLCEIIVPLPPDAAHMAPIGKGSTPFRDALIQIASGQLERYKGVNEANEPLRTRIQHYWDELNQVVPGGTFKFESVSVPWSAVFISWCVMQAGASPTDFLFSPEHSQYVKNAIARAKEDGSHNNFVALRITNYSPQPGDLIQNNRSGGNISYDDAAVKDDYNSHAVIVVGIGRNSDGPCAITIGGNETDSVRTHQVPLDSNGMIVQRQPNSYICVIKTS